MEEILVVKIGHAVMDENGSITGLETGDQTGKEAALAKRYAKNIGYVATSR